MTDGNKMSAKQSASLREIAEQVVTTLETKNPKYGESWKSKGGFSAFFNLDRKWSRVETLAREYGYDVFSAALNTENEPDSMEEALKDLIGYALLTLDHVRRVERPEAERE